MKNEIDTRSDGHGSQGGGPHSYTQNDQKNESGQQATDDESDIGKPDRGQDSEQDHPRKRALASRLKATR